MVQTNGQAKKHYQNVVAYYKQLGQDDAIRAIVEEEETQTPIKAKDFAYHLLQDTLNPR